ncbi:WXG100 family type VII secretion target [Amycolatopsis sp. NPDC051061]|uniref:WXG100 family type VII secretion target n=1 Tax=Amycolatopsis sp. NPDC051061 TaxID=3155042 RepID=UPI0034256EE1
MPSDIKVNYATIQAAADDCKSTGSELKQAFDQLISDLSPLMNTWTGKAKDDYVEYQRKWNEKHDELNQVLAQIASALPQIADGYQSTDNAVNALFH